MDTKICSVCKVDMVLDEFYKNQSTCKNCQREYRRHYYQRNKAKYKERGRKFQVANPEKCRQYVRDYYYRNQEKIQSKMCAKYHERQARKKGQRYDRGITREALMSRDKYICGICEGKVVWGDESVDHIIPVSKNGRHVWANVQLAHLTCNISKGDRT